MEQMQEWAVSKYKFLKEWIYQKQVNIVILGLQNSGKSCLVEFLQGNQFSTDTIPTTHHETRFFKHNSINIKCWDLSGQSRFHSIWEKYCDAADLLVYCIDLADSNAFTQSKMKLIELIKSTSHMNTPLLILGTKADLCSETEKLSLILKSDPIPTENHATMADIDEFLQVLGLDLAKSELREGEAIVPFPQRCVAVFTTSCKSKYGMDEVLRWLTNATS